MDIYLHSVGSKIPALSATKSPVVDSAATPSRTGSVDANHSAHASLRMNEIKKMLGAVPIVDEEQVVRLANAIQAGHYEINPQKAAEKIIELELMLP